MNWKPFVILSLLLAAVLPVMARDAKPFTLKGKLTGVDNKYIYLSYSPDSRMYKMDSALVKKGSFTFKGTLEHPVMAMLTLLLMKRGYYSKLF